MKSAFKIKNFEIKENSRIFIIAEAGVNHNGELEKALQLVDMAADCGADAVKFQTYRPEDVVTKKAEMAEYQKKNMNKVTSQLEMIKSFWLDEKYYLQIVRRCRKRGVMFMSTPHGGRKSVDLLESLPIPVYKIASGDLTNYLLLNKLVQTGKPLILSTGMASMEEVKNALNFIKSKGNNPVAILHATTSYPCPPEEVNLRAMVNMMKQLDVPVGFSDHTTSHTAAITAASLGMAIYECHFTLDKNLTGPDHKASVEPAELKERIRLIRSVEMILGRSEKKPTRSESKSMRTVVRKSIVIVNDLSAGHILKEADLEAKRPGDGIAPTEYVRFIGKKLRKNLKKDHQISLQDVE